jgi:hypothetical protein
MFELIESHPPVDVSEAEYQRLLGYPKSRRIEGRARELADAARAWFLEHGRPWIHAHETGALELRNERVCFGTAEFASPRLHALFAEAQAHGAVLLAVSAGHECEEQARQLWQDGKPDEFFFLKVFGSAVVEHLVMQASGRICAWADDRQMAVLPHFSPGYAGWDIRDQASLWDLFRQQPALNGRWPGKLEVLESGMLRPEKSLLAIFGLTRDLEKARRSARLIPCESCPLPNCRFRRVAYKRSSTSAG